MTTQKVFVTPDMAKTILNGHNRLFATRPHKETIKAYKRRMKKARW